MSLRFGDVAFDPGARELTLAGRRVELSPKAVELLLALLEAWPRALSRAELHDRLWPGTFVSGASLRQVVMELRRALGDDPTAPRYVRTVRRFGYAFSGEAREETESPPAGPPRPSRCSLLRGVRELPLYEDNAHGPGLTAGLARPDLPRHGLGRDSPGATLWPWPHASPTSWSASAGSRWTSTTA